MSDLMKIANDSLQGKEDSESVDVESMHSRACRWVEEIRAAPLTNEEAIALAGVMAQLVLVEEIQSLRSDLRELIEPALWLGRLNQ